MFGQMLANVLRQENDLVVTDVTSEPLLLTSVPHDVAVVSAVLEDDRQKGFKLVQAICESFPETKVVMLLDASYPDMVVESFRIGARGVFCRTEELELLPKCVRGVHAGQIWANAQQVEFVFSAFREGRFMRWIGTDGKGMLSAREQEVVRLVVEGLNNREIAARLELTEHTVKNYMFHIFNKLGISNRVELVLYAQRMVMK